MLKLALLFIEISFVLPFSAFACQIGDNEKIGEMHFQDGVKASEAGRWEDAIQS